jgi:hypothetical protein
MNRFLFRVFVVLTLVAVPAFGSQSYAQTNLLVNPGFEDAGGSYDGWFTFGDGPQLSTPDTDNIARTDSTAAKIFGEFTGCPGPHGYNVGGFGQDFTPTVGKVYQFNGYSYVSSGDAIPGTETCVKNRCIAKVVFWDADSAGFELSSNEFVIGDGNTVTDEWHYFSISAPAPAGAQRVEALVLFLQPECDTGSVFIDDTEFYELPEESATNLLTNGSFDGGLTGWNTFGNAWYDGRNWAVRSPMGSAKMFSSFDPNSDTGIYQSIGANDSCYYLTVHSLNTCREDAVVDTNDNFALAVLQFRDAADSVVRAREKVIANSASPLGTWTEHNIIARAPVDAESVDVYLLFISPTLMGGAFWFDDVVLDAEPPAGVPDGPVATGFRLHQNSPNPFGSGTRISFDLPRPARVKLSVYNVQGELVSTILDEHMTEGHKSVTWDARDSRGAAAASGIYFYRLSAGRLAQTKKMLLMR